MALGHDTVLVLCLGWRILGCLPWRRAPPGLVAGTPAFPGVLSSRFFVLDGTYECVLGDGCLRDSSDRDLRHGTFGALDAAVKTVRLGGGIEPDDNHKLSMAQRLMAGAAARENIQMTLVGAALGWSSRPGHDPHGRDP
jgi:hypothetical protein